MAAAIAIAAAGFSQVRYRVTDLAAVLGQSGVIEPRAINNLGHVVGDYSANGEGTQHAFLYDGVTVADLGTLGGPGAVAYGLNDSDQIVGVSLTASGATHAFFCSGGRMTDLGVLPGGSHSVAFGINGDGLVVGRGDGVPGTGTHGILWSAGRTIDLGSLGGTITQPNAINRAGQITGYSYVEDFTPPHAFVYSNGTMADLGNPGGRGSAGNAINDLGQVVGYYDLPPDAGRPVRHAVLFSAGQATDLGTLGGPWSIANGINRAGVIVGTSYSTPVGGVRAFVYADGQMRDLNALADLASGGASILYEAVAINDRGQIVCTGSGRLPTSAFLLTPIGSSDSRIANFSIRAATGTGEQALTGGFVLAGGGQPVLVRGVGPALANFGIAAPAGDPRIDLFSGGTMIFNNDNWGSATSAAPLAAATLRAGAFPLADNSKDAALAPVLSPGAYSFSVVVAGAAGGVGLAEIYDASDRTQSQRLVNASGRAVVGSGENLAIAGFTIAGNAPRTVLLRAAGPALAQFGVTAPLADPRLTLFAGGAVLASNNDWGTDLTAMPIAVAAQQCGAFQFANGSKDAALLVTLQPGAYAMHVVGVAGATGVGLLEIYDVPQ